MYRMVLALLLVLFTLVGCVAPTSPLMVVLATPVNGSVTQTLSPTMTWVGIGNNRYHLQIASDSGFQNLVVNDSSLTQLVYVVPAGRLSTASTYFWRVRASSGSETGPWATAWYFVTPGGSPTPPPGATGTINIATTLDGVSWYGTISYTLTGPVTVSGTATPQTFNSMPAGSYLLTFNHGGPPGANFISISPSASDSLVGGRSLNFTMAFSNPVSGSSVQTSATLNGMPWSGAVQYSLTHYTINGPVEDNEYSVPRTVGYIPSGNIQLNYRSGGPEGATLSSISPSNQQNVPPGGTVYFVMNFVRQQPQPTYGTISVSATLNGAPWQVAMGSGSISYSLIGPSSHTSNNVPATFSSQPTGSYTLTYNSGGPTGAVLSSISPSASQTLSSGGSIHYTLNFYSQARGTVNVTATLNGEPWSGSVGYVVHGPYIESGSHVPQSFSNAATGTYTISYSSGGPPSCVLESITPSSQILPAGGSINFNLHFRYQGGVLPGPLVQ